MPSFPRILGGSALAGPWKATAAPSTPDAPDTAAALLESGDDVLLESGDGALLEGDTSAGEALLEDGTDILMESGDDAVLESGAESADALAEDGSDGAMEDGDEVALEGVLSWTIGYFQAIEERASADAWRSCQAMEEP